VEGQYGAEVMSIYSGARMPRVRLCSTSQLTSYCVPLCRSFFIIAGEMVPLGFGERSGSREGGKKESLLPADSSSFQVTLSQSRKISHDLMLNDLKNKAQIHKDRE
jgi:hypothetical protein